MKKILLISNESQLNGAPRSLLEFAINLREKFIFTVLLPENKKEIVSLLKQKNIQIIVLNEIKNLYKYWVGRRILINLKLFFKILRLIKVKKFEAIYINTLSARFVAIPALMARICYKTRIIWHVREYSHNTLIQSLSIFLIKVIPNIAITNSVYNKKKIHNRASITIYNGVKQIPESKISPIPYPPKLLFIGRVTEEKGILDIVEAYEKIDSKFCPPLDVVGTSSDIDFFKNLVQNKGLSNHITFLGLQGSVSRFIQRSSILVLPSHREGGPSRVILEAFSYGRPVIASKVGGIPEIVNNKNGILIDPNDTEQLKDAILLLSNNKNLIIDKGKNARVTAKNYTLKKYVRNINEIFNKI